MIKLTEFILNQPDKNDVIYVAPHSIVLVVEGAYGDTISTFIEVTPGTIRSFIYVKESAKEVFRLITEYKQRQMRLQAAYNYNAQYLDPGQLESEDRGE